MAVVAALQARLADFWWRTAVRPGDGRASRIGEKTFSVLIGLLLTTTLLCAMPSSATAQVFSYNPRAPRPVTTRPVNDNQMLVQAN